MSDDMFNKVQRFAAAFVGTVMILSISIVAMALAVRFAFYIWE